MVNKHSEQIENLAKELLEKETLDLIDILRILGERPFPLSDSMKDYMHEIETRRLDKIQRDEKKKEDDKKIEEENKDKNDEDKGDEDKKSDEFDKDKDHRESDKNKKKKGEEGGSPLPPKDPQERDITEAETIMKLKLH